MKKQNTHQEELPLNEFKNSLKAVDSSSSFNEAMQKVKTKNEQEMVSILWDRKSPTFSVLHPLSDFALTLDMPISEMKMSFLNIISNQTPFIITGYIADEKVLKQIFVRKMAHSEHAKPIVDGFLPLKDVARRIKTKATVIEFWCDTYNVPYAIGSNGKRRVSAYGFDIIKSIKEKLDSGSSPIDI